MLILSYVAFGILGFSACSVADQFDCPWNKTACSQSLSHTSSSENSGVSISNARDASQTTEDGLSETSDHSYLTESSTEDPDLPFENGSEDDAEDDEFDTPQPLVSKKDHDAIMTVLDVFLFVMEGVSVLLTATSAWVYLQRDMRCTTAVYLVALNLADTVCGVLVVWSGVWGYLGGPAAKGSLAYNYLTVAGTIYLSLCTRRIVYCASAIVSLERFFVITFPLKARYFKIIRFPKLTVLSLFFVVLVFHSFLPLKYKLKASARIPGTYMIGYTDAYRANVDDFEIVSNATKFLFAYLPLLTGLGLSVALITALRRHASSRASLQEGSCKDDQAKASQIRSSERQLAMTIWLSTFLFTVLSLPNNTLHLVSTYHATFGYLKLNHHLYRVVSRFSYLTLVSTRYTNFCSYLGLSTAFRRNLVRAVCPRGVATKILGSTSDARDRLSSYGTGRGTSMARQTEVSTVSSSY